jgi:vacuolar-type H+-ATPase subunit F/Vma7
MPAPAFIGDEVSAAGFRLAGAQVRVPALGEELGELREALREAELILITAETAARIPAAVLRPILAAARPLVLLVRDVRGAVAVPDVVGPIRTQLGMAESADGG